MWPIIWKSYTIATSSFVLANEY